jgi:hypothetical protein
LDSGISAVVNFKPFILKLIWTHYCVLSNYSNIMHFFTIVYISFGNEFVIYIKYLIIQHNKFWVNSKRLL